MTMKELENRLAAVEKGVEELRAKLPGGNGKKEPWWVTEAGLFADDPGFEEMCRLGREYRQSLHPDYKKKTRKKKVTTGKNNGGV